MNLRKEIEEAYENLANAIIVKAAQDYKTAYSRVMYGRGNRRSEERAEECEDFFLSDWFRELTVIDGEELMMMIRSECKRRAK